jgi:hypothetical protein
MPLFVQVGNEEFTGERKVGFVSQKPFPVKQVQTLALT